MIELAYKIRRARRSADLSQQDLGRKIGVSKTAVSAYETGRAIPPLPTLKKISKITKLSLEYFTESKTGEISLSQLNKNLLKIRGEVRKLAKLIKKNGK